MSSDDYMYDPVSKEHAKARNTNLNEDLGKVWGLWASKGSVQGSVPGLDRPWICLGKSSGLIA